MEKRGLKVSVLFFSLLISFTFAYLFYSRYCKKHVRQNKIKEVLGVWRGRGRCVEQLLENNQKDGFSAVTDFDRQIFLSKLLYEREWMFGKLRYKYKPNQEVTNVMVGNKGFVSKLVIPHTKTNEDILKACDIKNKMTFKTDSLGFKNPVGGHYDNDHKNVIFLGDSFTEGLWIKPQKVFSYEFEKQLQNEGAKVNSMNLGVNGYSVMEEYFVLMKYFGEIAPNMVILNLFPNDAGSDYQQVLSGEVSEDDYLKMFNFLNKLTDFCMTRGIGLLVSVIPAKEEYNS